MRKRLISFILVICFTFIAVVGKIAYINVNQSHYTSLTTNTVSLTLDSKRGTFYDRYFSKLTDSTKSYVAIIKPDEKCISELNQFFDEDEIESVVEQLSKGFPIIRRVTKKITSTENIKVISVYDRYSDHQILAHTLGVYSENANNLSGLEKCYNDWMTMESTLKIKYSVDALGRMLAGDSGKLLSVNYDSRRGVKLTVDKNIQKICETAADNKNDFVKGSIVVLDVATSEILAAVSRPNIDPNNLTQSLNDTNAPFLNRSFSEYTVGSVFKLLISACAIENHMDTIEYECTGSIQIDDVVFGCNNKTGHAVMTLESALEKSCNTYFINLGQQIGAEKLLDTAQKFGFGMETPLADGFHSKAGNLPTYASLKSSGSLANFSFGQGDLLATPLQIANMVACIANNGVYNQPKLIECLIDDNGGVRQVQTAGETQKEIMTQETAKKLQNIMYQTVENGTGKNAKPDNLSAGGKTATAQTGWLDDTGKETLHSYFAGFYPVENPKYAIVVFNEDGKSGSSDCCPIFKEIADQLYMLG